MGIQIAVGVQSEFKLDGSGNRVAGLGLGECAELFNSRIVCASSVWVSGVAARLYYVKVCDVKSIVIRLRAFAATSS
jgi:hypothetical protein